MSDMHCEEVTYTKPSTGEVTDRVIIPVSQPTPNVKAIDVTNLDAYDRAEMTKLFSNYQEYVALCVSKIYSFETFISHTTGEDLEVKWRTFNAHNLERAD